MFSNILHKILNVFLHFGYILHKIHTKIQKVKTKTYFCMQNYAQSVSKKLDTVQKA